ncbi:MAG: response regulator, partial [Erysipelotrichaceae bacterium]|nr:response regulator [Erysipelotrichaceae bacterium]
VFITVKPSGEKAILEFVCRDNGIGMSEEFLKKIFDPFTRASSTTISRVEGTGLGMSSVRRLVETMDGTINITSKEGEGTEVTIRIPLFYEKTAIDTAAIKDKKILIVEDDENARSVFDSYLDEFEISHQTVSDSSEAIARLTEAEFNGEPFDMVIIGRKWSGNGDVFEFASYIRQRSSSIAIVLANEMDWSEIEYRATRSGISGFIPVPFLRKALLNGLNDVLVTSSTEEAHNTAPDLSGQNILLVEDNMINRIIANELLNSTNAHVENAENGREAVDKYLASPDGYYRVILMDIQMPVMDGYEASRLIRNSRRKDASDIRIISMTANIFAQDIAKAREAGMDGHVAKPIDVTKLMQALRQV